MPNRLPKISVPAKLADFGWEVGWPVLRTFGQALLGGGGVAITGEATGGPPASGGKTLSAALAIAGVALYQNLSEYVDKRKPPPLSVPDDKLPPNG